MADETSTDQPAKCLACEIAWYTLISLGVAAIAFMAWDVLSQGQATETVTKLFARAAPKLAAVQPIRGNDDADAG